MPGPRWTLHPPPRQPCSTCICRHIRCVLPTSAAEPHTPRPDHALAKGGKVARISNAHLNPFLRILLQDTVQGAQRVDVMHSVTRAPVAQQAFPPAMPHMGVQGTQRAQWTTKVHIRNRAVPASYRFTA